MKKPVRKQHWVEQISIRHAKGTKRALKARARKGETFSELMRRVVDNFLWREG